MRYLPAITIERRFGWNEMVISGMRWALEVICSLWNCANSWLLLFRWIDEYDQADWEYKLADLLGWLEEKGCQITMLDKLGGSYLYAMQFVDDSGNTIKMEVFWYIDAYMEELGMNEIPLLEVEINGRRLMYVRFVRRKKKQDVDSLIRQLGYIWGMVDGQVDLGEGWIRGYRKKTAVSKIRRKSWAIWLLEKRRIQERKIEMIVEEQRKAKERDRMVEAARSSIEDIQIDDGVLKKLEETAERLDDFEYVVEECRRRGLTRLAEKIERAKLIDESRGFIKREKKMRMLPDGLLVEEETGEESLAYIREELVDEKIDDDLRRKLDAVWPKKKKSKKKMSKKPAGRKLKKVRAVILEDGSFVLVEEDA